MDDDSGQLLREQELLNIVRSSVEKQARLFHQVGRWEVATTP